MTDFTKSTLIPEKFFNENYIIVECLHERDGDISYYEEMAFWEMPEEKDCLLHDYNRMTVYVHPREVDDFFEDFLERHSEFSQNLTFHGYLFDDRVVLDEPKSDYMEHNYKYIAVVLSINDKE